MRILLVVLAFLPFPPLVRCTVGDLGVRLLPEPTQQALLEELSGEIAWDHVTMITRFERVQASEGWHAAAEYVKSALEKYGFTDAVIEGWRSDGETLYYTWYTPIGWRCRSAELWVLEPFKRRIASYTEIPNTLLKHSRSADVTADLVDVGEGTRSEDYRGKDVRGKIVLATGHTGAVHSEAVIKRSAAGVVAYIPPDVRKEHPDLIRYVGMFLPKKYFDRVGFGFNVSKSAGLELSGFLRAGKKVILHATVESEYYDSKIEVLSTTIRGATSPDEEVLLVAHLDHPQPSANDNASGSAGILEIARTYRALIDRGVLPLPKRTIRFLWVSEFYGTVAYLNAHPERQTRTLAMINCDMIGEDLAKTASTFNITRTPDSRPTYLNDLVVRIASDADRLNITSVRGSNLPMNWRVTPYSGGSDHYFFNDGTIAVPAVMFGHWPDPFHHTAQDTPDKTDPTELRRVSFIAAAAIWFIANAEERDARVLADEVARGALTRLADALAKAKRLVASSHDASGLHGNYKESLNVISHAVDRERRSVQSVVVLSQAPKVQSYVEKLAWNIGAYAEILKSELDQLYETLCAGLATKPREPSTTEEEQRAARLVPRRVETFKAPLRDGYLEGVLGEERVRAIMRLSEDVAYEALNFCDGVRSVLDIRNALSAEFDPQPLPDVESYFTLLAEAQLVTIQTR